MCDTEKPANLFEAAFQKPATFFMEIRSRRVWLGGITRHPDSARMQQVARNATMEETGYLNGCRYVLHDRDKKFGGEFATTLTAGGVKCVPLPARSPNLNARKSSSRIVDAEAD